MKLYEKTRRADMMRNIARGLTHVFGAALVVVLLWVFAWALCAVDPVCFASNF